jgi:hypothetical protein
MTEPYKTGALVRYGGGSTALLEIISQHAGGYHGFHCMGGVGYASHDRCIPARPEDYKTWFECTEWRKDTDRARYLKTPATAESTAAWGLSRAFWGGIPDHSERKG